MDDLEQLAESGDIPANALIVSALVVVELAYTDQDGETDSAVRARTTDDRNVIGRGLAQRATQAMLDTDCPMPRRTSTITGPRSGGRGSAA